MRILVLSQYFWPENFRINDLVAALVNLGYKPALAEGAVGAARKEAPEAAFHELLRLALRRLSRV